MFFSIYLSKDLGIIIKQDGENMESEYFLQTIAGQIIAFVLVILYFFLKGFLNKRVYLRKNSIRARIAQKFYIFYGQKPEKNELEVILKEIKKHQIGEDSWYIVIQKQRNYQSYISTR